MVYRLHFRTFSIGMANHNRKENHQNQLPKAHAGRPRNATLDVGRYVMWLVDGRRDVHCVLYPTFVCSIKT